MHRLEVSGEIIAHSGSGPSYRLIRLRQAQLAAAARPGHHLIFKGEKSWPILRANGKAEWIEVLYPTADDPELSMKKSGESVAVTLDESATFRAPDTGRCLLLGHEIGIAPILFLSLTLATDKRPQMVLLGSDGAFPFQPHPSQLLVPELGGPLIATLPLLEERGIACRLAHAQGAPGCFEGSVVELAAHWLKQLPDEELRTIRIYSYGGLPGVAALADQYALPLDILTPG